MKRVAMLLILLTACGNSVVERPAAAPATAPIEAPRPAPSSTTTTSSASTTTPLGAATESNLAGSSVGGPATADHLNVAVIGCSQTRDAIFGYNALTDDVRFGDDDQAGYLSGGSIDIWAEAGKKKWATFENLVGTDTDALWIMLCWHVQRSPGSDVDTVGGIIERAHAAIGREVPTYVSGLNDWDPRDLCRKADYPASWELADAVAAGGLALLGPNLGPITAEETRDGCHGNEVGNVVMGEQLLEFFG